MNVNTLKDRQKESTMHTVWVFAEKEKDGNIIRKDRLCESVLRENIKREAFAKTEKFGKTVWRFEKDRGGLKDATRERQVRVDQFLESLGHKSIAAKHDLYRGALEDRLEGDIVTHGDDLYMADTERFCLHPVLG